MRTRNLKVYRKIVSIVNETSMGIYKNLGSDKIGFLLESYDKDYDRYTFMGVEPEEIICSSGQSIVIKGRNGEKEVIEGNPIDILKDYYNHFHVEREPGELAFMGGLVGSLGYDYIRYTEVLPDNNPDEIGIETVQLMLATKFIVIDHVAETLSAVILYEGGEEGKKAAQGEAEVLLEKALTDREEEKKEFVHDGVIVKKSDTLEEYSE
ncbi:MAG: anthranilate synthase component I, partial [Lachnospiraceae bacterium]